MRISRTPRRGLTLVELLVAAALSLVIMTVLASAFQTGMDTLSQLKSVGELQERLRSASEQIKADLQAPHFDDPTVAGGKLSNVRFDLNPNANPTSGMFRIVQVGSSYQEFIQKYPFTNQTYPPTAQNYSTIASPAPKQVTPAPAYTPYNVTFTSPLNGVTSYGPRPSGNAHAMQFAVKQDGKTRQNVFTALRPATTPGNALDNKFDNLVQTSANPALPPQTYATRWAVVSYFLADSGTKTGSGSPLYNLCRRVQLVAEQPGAILDQTSPTFATSLANYSTHTEKAGTVVKINTVNDLTAVALRPSVFAPIGDGSDVVMANVVSFEVKANWDGGFRKMTPNPAVSMDLPNFDFPFDDLPPFKQSTLGGSAQFDDKPRVFDTAFDVNSTEAMLGIPVTNHAKVRINAIQIKLRVWDPKNRGARQMTIVQDM